MTGVLEFSKVLLWTLKPAWSILCRVVTVRSHQWCAWELIVEAVHRTEHNQIAIENYSSLPWNYAYNLVMLSTSRRNCPYIQVPFQLVLQIQILQGDAFVRWKQATKFPPASMWYYTTTVVVSNVSLLRHMWIILSTFYYWHLLLKKVRCTQQEPWHYLQCETNVMDVVFQMRQWTQLMKREVTSALKASNRAHCYSAQVHKSASTWKKQELRSFISDKTCSRTFRINIEVRIIIDADTVDRLVLICKHARHTTIISTMSHLV